MTTATEISAAPLKGARAVARIEALDRVPVRQWVLTFPHPLRYRLAYDAQMVTAFWTSSPRRFSRHWCAAPGNSGRCGKPNAAL